MSGLIALECAATASPARSGMRASGWGAVFALTLCVATLIESEFMPLSLLTPIAADLHMTEGQAGQAIAVSGIFAVLTRGRHDQELPLGSRRSNQPTMRTARPRRMGGRDQ